MIDQLLLGNMKFRESDFDGNIELFRKLTQGQSPKVLWIGCSDSRVLPERITSSQPGDIFVQRNIGNIVPIHDWNFATVLEYALVHLKVSDIVVCGHADCGAMKALDKETNDVYIPLWLNNARDARSIVDSRIQKTPQTPEEKRERSRQIEVENVRIQIDHLKSYPLVKQGLADGKIEIHGLYYDLFTGKLTKVF